MIPLVFLRQSHPVLRRSPAVIVSPFVRKGHVDSTLLETISITKFIEELGRVNGTVIPTTRTVTSLAKVFVDAANLNSPSAHGAPESSESGIPTSLIVLAGVIVAMLAILIGFIVYLLIRNKRAARAESPDSQTRKGHTYLNRAPSYGQLDEEVAE